jgi:hypothetical protein
MKDKNEFSIGDVVIPYWCPSQRMKEDTKSIFLFEVVRFDGSYILCKKINVINDYIKYKDMIHFLPNEISVDKSLSRDNKIKKLYI